MHRPLFLHIAGAVERHDTWFEQERNHAGVLGLHPFAKDDCGFSDACLWNIS